MPVEVVPGGQPLRNRDRERAALGKQITDPQMLEPSDCWNLPEGQLLTTLS